MDYDVSVRAFLTERNARLHPRHESSIANVTLRVFPRFYDRAVVGSCLGSGGYVSRPRVRDLAFPLGIYQDVN